MRNYLDKLVQLKIKERALRSPDMEICGVIGVDHANSVRVIGVRNVSQKPSESFVMPRSVFEHANKTLKILAIWHSHPGDNHELSLSDRWMSERLGVDMVMYCVGTDGFLVHSPCGFEVPYVDRPFVHGVFDCWALVSDWYLRELNIHLPVLCHPVRDAVNHREYVKTVKFSCVHEPDWFVQFLMRCGFQICRDKLRKHDIILMKSETIPIATHSAIFIGGERILHHPADGNSIREHYSSSYKQDTVCWMRHPIVR